MQDVKDLLFTLHDLISYSHFIKNAYNMAGKAIPKNAKDYDNKFIESFQYLLEVHIGKDIRDKYQQAFNLEKKIYKNSKKYKPKLDEAEVSKALTQISAIYNALQKEIKDDAN